MSTRSFVVLTVVIVVLAAAVFYMHGPGSHERMHTLRAMIHGGR
jgi:hypothetical protein